MNTVVMIIYHLTQTRAFDVKILSEFFDFKAFKFIKIKI
mgnify:CR=1 FL=1